MVQALEFHEFCQLIVDRWSTYMDATTGAPLPFKCHWAKQWDLISIKGKHYLEYYTKLCSANIQKFKKDIKAVAKAGGTKYKYCIRHFSNNTLDYLLGETTKLPVSYLDQISLKKNSSPQKMRRNSIGTAPLFSGPGSATSELSVASRRSPARASNPPFSEGDSIPTRIFVNEGEYVTREISDDD